MVDDGSTDPYASWWTHHATGVKTFARILLGLALLIDGYLKFQSGYNNQQFLADVQSQQQSAPSWLSGWYSFWATQATNNSNAIVYSVGTLELLIGLALVFGFMRKFAYVGGIALTLLIWAIPEGFGGPYTVSGSAATDVGTGIIYAIAFVGLIAISATYGSSRFSIDYYIEKRFPAWARLSEFGTPLWGPMRPPRGVPPKAPAS
jgi:nitrite reductase (NO-forming)